MRRFTGIVLAVVLVSLAVACAAPFALMLFTSFRTTTTFAVSWDSLQLHFDNYIALFETYDFVPRIATTIVVVIIACLANVFTATLAAYGLSKRPFPGSTAVYWVILATMMVPIQVTLVPLYTIMRQLGLLNTYLGLALPLVTGFGVFLMKQFTDRLPDELIEAARVDGAPDRLIFFRVAIPLMRPVITALVIFTFLAAWNDFLWPLVSISQDQMQTLTYAIANLQGRSTTNYGLVTAGATVSFLGPFIAYLILQRRFVEGIALTGTKG
jgi:multiple sugar transport system permease protein